jgi:hypothetical protein
VNVKKKKEGKKDSECEEYTKNMLPVKPTCTENTDLQLSVLDESDRNKNKSRINMFKEMACFSTAQEAALIKAGKLARVVNLMSPAQFQ